MPVGRVRIIAGTWRSRQIKVAPGVRPAQDVQRETLFNILRSVITDARCLDLFAGSGSLGLEALSRGAKEITFVERSRKIVAVLRANIASLDSAARTCVYHEQAHTWLARTHDQIFDMVFIDPPYALSAQRGWWATMLATVLAVTHQQTKVFCEGPALIVPPDDWQLLRAGKSGSAHWSLVTPKSS